MLASAVTWSVLTRSSPREMRLSPIARFSIGTCTSSGSPLTRSRQYQVSRCIGARAAHTDASSLKPPGTIASVFATLSGGSLSDSLPGRFLQFKQSLVRDKKHARALICAWNEVLHELNICTANVEARGASLIPTIKYPGDEIASSEPIERWADEKSAAALKECGTVIVKGVVPSSQALQWKKDIQDYVRKNPHTRGFPNDDPQVFELYWSKAQLAARGHPSFLKASQAMLSLWHGSRAVSDDEAEAQNRHYVMSTSPLTYCDRLRIRLPGDSQFALGPHIDGGGVERWEDPTFRGCWSSILQPGHTGRIDWQSHDSWSLGRQNERLGAQTDMYGAAGACSVFRPLQGWLSMSSTGPSEGTLRVLPFMKAATAYIILRPFFRPRRELAAFENDEEKYLKAENWAFDVSDPHFDGCTLGRNIELSTVTHPHLRLDRTMVSIPCVEPGDVAFWHCDVVHAVESKHQGLPGHDSSVLYIPAIPLTAANFRYIQQQRQAFEQGTPPEDFPGGEGESRHVGRGEPMDIKDLAARRAMGLEPFEVRDNIPEGERELFEACNKALPP